MSNLREELLIVRTDVASGNKELVTWENAEAAILHLFGSNDKGHLKALSMGHPVRTVFATYQHRDFVEGWSR